MLNIQFYCKNIKYITAFANQIYQFTVHGHALYNLRVTVVVHKAFKEKETKDKYGNI